jgi:hypothetical protein
MARTIRTLVSRVQDLLASEYEDEFIVRLRQVNTGLIRKGNIAGLRAAIAQMPAGDIVEIGTFTGCTANIIAHLCNLSNRTEARIFTCDRWSYGFKGLTGSELIGKSTLTISDWSQFARDTAIRNMQFFSRGARLHPIELFSNEFLSAWASRSTVQDLFGARIELGGSIAFAFIDGNHEYEAVTSDLQALLPFMQQDGVIFFDDSADYTGSPGVCRLMGEIKKAPEQYGLRVIER